MNKEQVIAWAREAGLEPTMTTTSNEVLAWDAEIKHLERLCALAYAAGAAAEPAYDQTALELCEVCGWKTLIPGDVCLNCEHEAAAQRQSARSAWVGLTDEEVDEAARYCVKSGQSVNAAIRAIEAKLREKNGGAA